MECQSYQKYSVSLLLQFNLFLTVIQTTFFQLKLIVGSFCSFRKKKEISETCTESNTKKHGEAF